MTVETSLEFYLFTCARCTARWAESYEVSQQSDDEGAIRSFYRHHGNPCEAPVSGNVECPRCHSSKVFRDPLYGAGPGFDPEAAADIAYAVPRQQAVTEVATPPDAPAVVRQAVAGTWHRYKFSAVVTLEHVGKTRRYYPSGAPGLLLRAPSVERPDVQQYFPAIAYVDDDRPLRVGDKGVTVVFSVPDDDASDFFQAGQHFTLWDGKDIGHGTVAERLFARWL